jgi:hypothetical protein
LTAPETKLRMWAVCCSSGPTVYQFEERCPRVDHKLHVERWLLLLKTAATSAGFEVHVRALDFKGGNFLAFSVLQGSEALEVRYRKGWTGTGMVAAATGSAITAGVRQVHERLLQEHVGVLENGLRRFLRRSIDLLTALEFALKQETDLPRRYEAALREVGGVVGARFAAVVRRRPGLRVKYEVLPAVAISQQGLGRFEGLSRGQLVDLSHLIKKEQRPA